MKNPDLERQILAAPEQPDAYLVYADWLQSQGDPRGELITTQHALQGDPDSSKLRATEESLLKTHGSLLIDLDPGPAAFQFEWFLGFWKALRLGMYGWSETPCTNDHVAEVLSHASARLSAPSPSKAKLRQKFWLFSLTIPKRFTPST